MLATALIRRHRALPGGHPFHLLLASLAVSQCGDWLYNVALLAVVYERTRSPVWVSVTTGARMLPLIVLGPLAGALADRHDRSRLMIGSDLARALLMVLLAATVAARLPVALVPLLATLAASAGTVTPPCVGACIPRLVSDADLQRANALRSAIGQGAVVAGPALGGLLVLVSTPAIAILVNAATFLASAAAIAAIPAGEALRGTTRPGADLPNLLDNIRAGARALRNAPVAVRVIAADVLCSAVYGLLTVTLVLVSRKVGAGVGGYGILLAGFGAGGVVGAIISGRASDPSRWRRWLTVALLLIAAVLPALGEAPSLIVALLFAAILGGGMVVGEVLSETALPRMLSAELLGSAFGLAIPCWISGIVAGSLIAGPLVSQLGLAGTMTVAGLFVLLTAALLVRHPLDDSPRASAERAPSLETADANP
jgi:predicted MFS family arabinose efflux permease